MLPSEPRDLITKVQGIAWWYSADGTTIEINLLTKCTVQNEKKESSKKIKLLQD